MQQTSRQPVSHRWVWIGLVALAVLVLGVFVVGYWLLVRYEDKVARHVPAETVGALRLDIEQVVLYQPIRKHVFPVLDGAKTQSDRLAKLKAETGVNLGMDLREILVAVLPEQQFVVAVGGLFPDEGLLAKVLRVLPTDHGCTLSGARVACRLATDSLWVEQAADGVVLASNSERALNAALTESGEGVRLGLQQAPITWVVKWGAAMGDLPLGLGPLGQPAWIKSVTGLVGQADLGDPMQLQLTLQGVRADQASAVSGALQQLQAVVGLVPGPDTAGERDVLARAAVEATPDGAVVVRSRWERKDLERAARAFADWLETALRL